MYKETKQILLIYIGLIGLLILSSCYTQKKAQRNVIKADVTYPTVVSGYCATKYAPKSSKGETIVKVVKGDERIDTFTHYDTLVNTVYKTIYKHRTDTIKLSTTDTILNTALVDKMAIELDAINDELSGVEAELQGEKSAKNVWKWLCIAVLAAIACVIGVKFVIPKVLS